MRTALRAVTLRQPWASLVAGGVKTIETRSWSIRHRGPVAIHAAKAGASLEAATEAWEALGRAVGCDGYEAWHNNAVGDVDYADPDLPVWPVGAIVATAQVVDCVPIVHYRDVDHHHDHRDALERQGRWLANGGDLVLWNGWGDREERAVYSDQRPLGHFSPGRWAWLLDDIAPTSGRCPACWDPDGGYDLEFRGRLRACPVCDDTGCCAPVPARGRQGLWSWEASVEEVPSHG